MANNVNRRNDCRANVAASSKPLLKRHGRRHYTQQAVRTLDSYGGRGDGERCGRTPVPSHGKSGTPGGGGRAENSGISAPVRRYCREFA